MKKIYSLLILVACTLTINAQLDRSVRPSSAPAKEIDIQDAKTFTLSNGLKVFLVEDHTSPLVYYSFSLDIKPALEKEKAGMGNLFDEVFGNETKNRTKEQVNKDIDMIGARASILRKGGYITTLKKYQDQALDIVSDILLNPVFKQEELDLGLSKYKTFLSSLGDDGGSINQRVSAALTYGKGYPEGEVETMETFDNITLADLQNYYNTYFAPNVTRMVIVGDLSESEAKQKVEKYFGKWQKKTVPVTQYTFPEAPQSTRIAFVNKPGAVQSSVDVSYPINFKIGSPNYEAALLMNQIFGGGGTGRLFLNLREKHSYTYGVYSNLTQNEQVGRFSLSAGRGDAASVKAAATDSAIYQIIYEMNEVIGKPVSSDELKAAKTYIAGNFSRSLENSGTIANFALNIDKYNLPKDYYKNYLKRLEAVTVQDIQNVARKYIRPENAWIVVTADKSYADGLTRLAGDNTIHYYDMNANPVEAPTTQEAGISAEELINRYVKAIGGSAAIDKIEDYELKADVSAMGQTLSMVQLFKKPNLSVTDITMNGMNIQKVAFDGTTVRISGMAGNQELTEGPEYEMMIANSGVCPEKDYIKNGYELTLSGIEKINNSNTYALEIKKGEQRSISYFDAETYLKVKTVSFVETPAGAQEAIVEYNNYNPVNGVQFPYSMKQNTAGMGMDMTVKSIEANKDLDISQFK